jgi:ferredoxin
LNMLKRIRIIVALVFFTATTLLFLDFTGTLHLWFGWLADVQFIPALLVLNVGVIIALVALTLVFGRVYCSVICPLGVFQDMVSWLAAKRKKHRFRTSPALNRLRYAVLAAFVAAFIVGAGSVVALLEPYSAYGRIASNLFSPLYRWGNNLMAYFAEQIDSYTFYSTEVLLKGGLTFGIATATLAAIVVLSWRNGRTYCNTLCPVGTVLGFVSRFSLLKPVIDAAKCNGCRICARNCKASCINEKEHKIDYSRCVACFDCIGNCRQKAIGYRFKKYANTQPAKDAQDENGVSRRSFLSLAALLGTASLAKAQQQLVNADGGRADIIDKVVPERLTPIMPAGSQSARHFAKHCTGCQLCVSICPTHVLRPSTKLFTLMQPVMSFERGYCLPECTKCSEVCPTGAITKITKEEKSSIQTGHAVWDRELCVVNADKQPCDNCFRHCPSSAVTMIDNPDAPEPERPANFWGPPPKPKKIPVISQELCIGCGACECLCPSRPLSAIRVEGHLMHKTI